MGNPSVDSLQWGAEAGVETVLPLSPGFRKGPMHFVLGRASDIRLGASRIRPVRLRTSEPRLCQEASWWQPAAGPNDHATFSGVWASSISYEPVMGLRPKDPNVLPSSRGERGPGKIARGPWNPRRE